MSDFFPISPLVGITNTSYGAQAGVMDDKWACRVVRGKKVIAEKTIPDLVLENYVGVIYGHVRLDGLSRHAVAMCAGRLMQFARRYQGSGVAPNFEIPDLVGDDGTPIVSSQQGVDAVESTSDVPPVAAEGEIESSEDEVVLLGALPDIKRLSDNDLWEKRAQAHGIMIGEMASYGAELPEGHLTAMFDRVANQLISKWKESSDPAAPAIEFGNLIQSCSKESQLPKTGTNKITIETGTCEILKMAREMDPDASRLPKGYPCAFHELIAEKVAARTGLKISVNTSSTGCIVTLTLEV
jgi:hypothetical protein